MGRSTPSDHTARLSLWAGAAVGLVLLVGGCGTTPAGPEGPVSAPAVSVTEGPSSAPASSASAASAPGSAVETRGPGAATPLEDVAAPVRVLIPAIGVDAAIGPLGLDAAGALEVPTVYADAGWYEPGPEPGERGPAVVAGHVDDYTGPAVFFRLTELLPGQEIQIQAADGTAVTFVVRSSETYSKSEFPTAKVYDPTENAQLRLITCGGGYDGAARRYLDNVVVYADMVG